MYYLKYWRNRKGLTQQELAEKVGCHINTINRFERGHRQPRSGDIKKLCQVLGVSETELMSGPARTELTVNFFWECDDVMADAMSIRANEFSWGYRSDGMLIVAGAIPWELSVDEVLGRIKAELIAAKEGKKARDEALKKELDGKEANANGGQNPDAREGQSATEGA